METSDIFTTITRYDKPENRFTASLVYLLRHLWKESKDNEARRHAYCKLLDCLCGEILPWGEQIDFEIQKTERADDDVDKRIPDFKITSPDNILVWVEVKDTAGITQVFKNDKGKLQKSARESGYENNRLVLLSHYSVSEKEKEGAYHRLRPITGGNSI